MYRHYSFDLWLTLIKSNPLFKAERAVYFHEHFNRKNKSLEEVNAIFRQVDLMCNQINEATGGNIDSEEMYLMVISQINNDEINLRDINIHELYERMEVLLMDHMPVMYCDDTLQVLATLKQPEGTTIGLLSNTGFIKGPTMRKVLNQLTIDQHLDFQFYSDEEGLSKPNIIFYERMLAKVRAHHPAIENHAILHIGDNDWADVAGAQKAGIHSLLINSNEKTIKHLLSNENNNLFTSQDQLQPAVWV